MSYSELLLAEGCGRPGLLLGHITAWHALFDLYGAEAVIVDHAPTALLAAHARRMARVQVGCGFTIPPATQPFPRIRAWKDLSDEQLARSDAVVLRSINACLTRIPGAAPLQHVSDLFQDAPACLATFPEIDHYGERQGAQYAGPLFGSANGLKVSWQSSQAPRVLSYLQNGSAGLRNMLKTFAPSARRKSSARSPASRRTWRKSFRRRPCGSFLIRFLITVIASPSLARNPAGTHTSRMKRRIVPARTGHRRVQLRNIPACCSNVHC